MARNKEVVDMDKVMVKKEEVVANHQMKKIGVKTLIKEEVVKEVKDGGKIKEGMLSLILNVIFAINLVIFLGI